ncbi:Kinesin-like protein KIN-5B [Camellia lanceoleosa]|uniref:Kinesin-like protein KIN-5B n=1 Tax=Camellia lanceoleosa TaxID=1840588 RepID=A0ACC0HJG9_9ERIC|nr:Kinesin-like protein KIN-5B [Camellia lanceoleosa]
MIANGIEDEDKWLTEGIARIQHNCFLYALCTGQKFVRAMVYMKNLSLDPHPLMQNTKLKPVTHRNQAEQCLRKDYLVDQHTSTTPKLKIIAVLSLASIEEMRTPVVGDLMANFTRPNLGCVHQAAGMEDGSVLVFWCFAAVLAEVTVVLRTVEH